jgi:hypothetical protein
MELKTKQIRSEIALYNLAQSEFSEMTSLNTIILTHKHKNVEKKTSFP